MVGNWPFNDDYDDKGAGLMTHHADSLIAATLPADGTYYLHLGDVQHKGGAEYAYRLRISEPRPDFALLVVPSSINVRAGASVPITVYALRKDGFAGEIATHVEGRPEGIHLERRPLRPTRISAAHADGPAVAAGRAASVRSKVVR